MHLQRPDVDASVRDASILRVDRVKGGGVKFQVARIDGRAAGQRFVSQGRAAVVCWRRPEHGIGDDLVTGSSRESPKIIAAQIVAARGDRARNC